MTQCQRSGYVHRREEVAAARARAVEVVLARQLYRRRSDGSPIHAEMTRLHHPARWYFDVLRCLDALRDAEVPLDPRMEPALDIVRSRRRADGRWAANRGYPGETHLAYPRAGQPNRWVTVIARRVLAWATCGADRSPRAARG